MIMNKVARYRGITNNDIITKEPGYIYINENGLVIVDELRNTKQIYDSKSIDDKLGEASIEQGNSNGDIASIQSRLDILEEKVSALKKTNTEVISVDTDAPVNLNDNTKDYVVSGDVTQTANINAKSLQLKNVEVSLPQGSALTNGNAVLVNATDDVEIKDGSFQMNNQVNSNCLKVTNADTLVIRDTTFTGATFNTIMTGQNSTDFIKNILIDNCDFNEDCKHINIWFAGHADNAVLTISNCHFRTSEQFLCISDYAGADNKLTVNIINCTVDNYDNKDLGGVYGQDYAGFMFIESRNIGNYETLVSKNPYGNGKVSINIENLVVKGVKVTNDNFKLATGEQDQSMYFYHKQSSGSGCIKYNEETKDLFPVITIK